MPAKCSVDVSKLVAEYAKTASLDKVAASTGLSKSTVKRRLRDAGVKFRGPRTVDPTRPAKRCHKCKKTKPVADFNRCRTRTDGRSATCRTCWAGYQAERTLRRKFGMTPVEFAARLAEQSGRCAICPAEFGATRAGKKQRLAVDHCHETGKVRGLLCANCNNGLGRFKDDPGLLERAAQYLRREGAQ